MRGIEEWVRERHICDHSGQGPGFAASKRCGVVFRLSPGCGEEDNRPEIPSVWKLFLGRGYISPIIPGPPQAKPLDWETLQDKGSPICLPNQTGGGLPKARAVVPT